MSTINVNTWEPESGTDLTLGASGDTITIPSGATITNSGTASGFGKVLQVLTANFTGTQTITSQDDSFTDITDLTIDITPAASDSRIMVMAAMGKVDVNSTSNTAQFIILRDSTRIGTGASAGNRILATFTQGVAGGNGRGAIGFSMLDTPATASQITYKVAGSAHSNDVYINRWSTDTDDDDGPSARTSSTLTVMEIGA